MSSADVKYTPVVFVRDLEDDQIIAVFPANSKRGLYPCYAHVGQHSFCSPAWVTERTAKADMESYERLEIELQSAPYEYHLVPFVSVAHALLWAKHSGHLIA